MGIRINLKKAERKILPEGDYVAQVALVEHRPRGKSGTGEPTMHVEVITQENDDPEHDGVRLFRDQSLQEQSLWSALEFVEACLGAVEGDAEGEFEFDPEDLVNSVVGIGVSMDDSYDGRVRNRVDRFFNLEAAERGDQEGEDGEDDEAPPEEESGESGGEEDEAGGEPLEEGSEQPTEEGEPPF